MTQNFGQIGQQNRTTPKKISLINGFANAINLPRHVNAEGEYPLYPHGDGSKVTMQRSQGWYKEAERTYNSPSNARVVCLSRDGANVLYWAPPVKGGKMSGQLEAASSYVFDKSAKIGVEQHINKHLYTWDNAGLQSLVNPVVFSNIEELWVSSEIFYCQKYAHYINMLNGLQFGQVAGVDFLATILEDEISTPSKRRTIADTFPLLRAIVVVKTLPNSQVQDFHRCAIRTEEVKNILETKYPNKRRTIGENPEIMQQIANVTGFGFAVQPITTGDVLKFSLGDYKYDQRVLLEFKNKLVDKYTPKVEPKPVKSVEPTEPVVSVKAVEPAIELKEFMDVDSDVASLEIIIKDMEVSSFSISEIKRALWAYKQGNPDYFKRQVSLLSKDTYNKYKEALK